jgi:hypothetical protein
MGKIGVVRFNGMVFALAKKEVRCQLCAETPWMFLGAI